MISRISSMQPLLNRCLVKKLAPKSVTKGGIILSEKSAGTSRFGVVIATGPGETDEKGNFVPLAVKVGDNVLLPEYSGTKVNMEDTESDYLLYRDTEILAVVEGLKH